MHQSHIPQCNILSRKCADVCKKGPFWVICLKHYGLWEMGLLDTQFVPPDRDTSTCCMSMIRYTKIRFETRLSDIKPLMNSSPPKQNGRHFGRRHFQMPVLYENDRIPIRISLKFAPWRPIDNKAALVQVMAWHRTGDKPLSEPMLTRLTDAHMWH